jgi:GNAT superfamily N-acetyltransferase
VLDLRPLPEAELPASRARLIDRAAARRMRTAYQDAETARVTASEVLDRGADALHFFDVVDGEQVVGWAVVWQRGDQCELNDLLLDDPTRGAEVLPALLALARANGCPAVGVAAVPGEPERDTLVAVEGFVPRATNLVLPLDHEIGDPGDLVLRTMTQEQFDSYLAGSTESYIQELAAAGMTPEAARRQGEQQMQELIPDGLDSEGQHFFTAYVGETAVGRFWISTERPMAFVYDIEVDESQRRKGYGEAIMNAGARWSRDRGHPALGLNVFAHNPGARALYDKLGYHVTADFRTIDVPDAG